MIYSIFLLVKKVYNSSILKGRGRKDNGFLNLSDTLKKRKLSPAIHTTSIYYNEKKRQHKNGKHDKICSFVTDFSYFQNFRPLERDWSEILNRFAETILFYNFNSAVSVRAISMKLYLLKWRWSRMQYIMDLLLKRI